MKFTPEQVIEMAREAGFDTMLFNSIDGDEAIDTAGVCITERITRLCTLAADRALEAAAVECDKYDSLRIDGAGETIRAMKEQA